MKVGFIGLGIMGRSMSGRLIDGGHELHVHSHKPAPKELTDKGARDCRTGGKYVAFNNPGGDETCTPTENRARRTPSPRDARDLFQSE